MMLAIALVSLCAISCGGDDDGEDDTKNVPATIADPEGTIITNLTNTFKEGFNGYYDNGIDNINGGLWCYLGMNSSNNLQVANRSSNIGYYSVNIASVGKVNGLSAIKDIPEIGWSKQVAAIPGYGYVYRMKYHNTYPPSDVYEGQYKYVRIYAVDYVTSTNSGIMGITIKYQENWEPDTK